MIKLNFLFTITLLYLTTVSSVLIAEREENLKSKILESFNSSSKKELFKVYHFLYEKKYDLKSEEGVNRYKIFKQTLKFIHETNSKNLSYKLGINQFSDITNEEFRAKISSHYIPEVDNMEFEPVEDKNLDTSFLPEQTNINWLSKLSPVLDQGVCGSCWAFTATGTIEGNYNIKYNESLQLSPQELVDCDTSNKGCLGGSPRTAMYSIAKNGISFLTDYSYTGLQSAFCNINNMKNYMVEAVNSCNAGSCTRSRVIQMLANGPVATTMDAGSMEFQSYTSGILKNIPCTTRNHAVINAGYYKDAIDEYYIARNSWSENWGERGNFRMGINDATQSCFMDYQAHYPILYPKNNATPKACIRLYPQCSFTGTPYEICDSIGTFAGFNNLVLGFSNIYSETLSLFTGGNCTGSAFITSFDNSCLSSTSSFLSFVNNIKSVVFINRDPVTAGCIKVYDDACAAGTNKVEICDSIADLSATNWANKISSIKMNRVGFISVTLYTGPNYSGSSSTISANRYSMTSTFENKIISIRFNR